MKSCVIDGEAIITNANGLTVFSLLRRQGGEGVALCAFDLVEVDGEDLPKAPFEDRKERL